ncbi:unnamed protein product [Wuchereria bancrofti]|uniref:Uncharacterized protein n=1 Tax=Wuchereria bancrofti TaxID=6293 RepID=A0A3P7DXA2_WUCBA|nr:unnamed protein product [Wuchereria bancrofti]
MNNYSGYQFHSFASIAAALSELITTPWKDKYDPHFARFVFEHAAAAYSRNPLKCLAKYYGTHILRQGSVSCDHLHDEVIFRLC